ncbi:glycosyltransferase family 2 protein [Hymenobacter terricola]|uniref:glycosyltransferase family 2 protein n=1 Tax=Hymenobacter terricola TaxID=2819236 RepID=UPI001B30BD86|nr:glycosyltransferase [Hymenobacter terricola]
MSLVSIIIPCYNYGWLLAETLDSVLAQTYAEWECFVVDDGSVDNTRAVAEFYQSRDARFRYLYQANAGMSAARNMALCLAQGEFIQFLDADDLLAPHKLAVQVAYLRKHPAVDVVYGDVRYFRHDAPAVLSRSFDMQDVPQLHHLEGSGLPVIESFVRQNEIVTNAPLLRARLIELAGPFTEGLRSMEDWEFWLRCAMQGARFKYEANPDTWALVRIHPTSTSQNRSRMMDYTRQVREQLEASLHQLGAQQAIAINREALRSILEIQAAAEFQEGRPRMGWQKFWQLGRSTGRYTYYMRAALYWLRQGPKNNNAVVGTPQSR